MKKKYLDLLRENLDEINRLKGDYNNGSFLSIFDKLGHVHAEFSKKSPNEYYCNNQLWKHPKAILVLDVADEDRNKEEREIIADLYLLISSAYHCWEILYALEFNKTAD